MSNIHKELQTNLNERIVKLFGAEGKVITDRKFIAQIQKILKDKGEDLGTYGDNKDGLDGLWGKISFSALIKFQEKNSCPATGTLNPETNFALGLLHQ